MSIARRELKVKVIGEGQCKMCVLHEYQLQRGRNESVLFISRPRSEGWQHHGRAFSIYLCTLIDSCTGSAVGNRGRPVRTKSRQNESLFRSNGTHVFVLLGFRSDGISFQWDGALQRVAYRL